MRFQKAVPEVDRGTIERISLTVDPRRTGFGKIPKPGAVRSPPLCRIHEGILGVDPAHATRGGDRGNDELCRRGFDCAGAPR